MSAPQLGTEVPTGQFDEKKGLENEPAKGRPVQDEEDEEDEDIDALIEDLESQDHNVDYDDEEDAQPGGARPVPEELLQTDTRIGLTTSEVANRRKKFGLNQMKEEKENLVLKFLMFFVGPIQFVMEAAAVLAAGLEVRSSLSHSLSHSS